MTKGSCEDSAASAGGSLPLAPATGAATRKRPWPRRAPATARRTRARDAVVPAGRIATKCQTRVTTLSHRVLCHTTIVRFEPASLQITPRRATPQARGKTYFSLKLHNV